VTEADWLKSRNPGPMLAYLGEKADPRKLRLFAVACARRVWHLPADEPSRTAVEVAEAFADGRASAKELKAAAEAVWAAGIEVRLVGKKAVRRQQARTAVRWAARAVVRWSAWWATEAAKWARLAAQTAGERDQIRAQAHLLRCIFGDPFDPAAPIPAEVLGWNGDAMVKVAEAIYQERAFDRLPVLADMLEEAGVTDPAIVGHCRGPGPHARGCFVLDAILRPSTPAPAVPGKPA
jgi:hypothetical protein